MNPNFNLWLIPLLPLAGAAVNGFWGRRYSRKTVSAVALLASGAAFVWAVICAFRFAGLPRTRLLHVEHYAVWLRTGNLSVPFAFLLDPLSLVMMLVVTGVGFLIHVYSVGYMAEEGGYYRFFST